MLTKSHPTHSAPSVLTQHQAPLHWSIAMEHVATVSPYRGQLLACETAPRAEGSGPPEHRPIRL